MPSPTFDIAAAVRSLATIFWTQFAAIVPMGLALLTLPSLISTGLFGIEPQGEAGTLVDTFLALFGMVFAAAVNAGVLTEARTPALFMRGGLALARPGVVVALLIGATVMLAAILRLAARIGGVGGALPGLILFGALFAFLVAAFVAIPAAIAERLFPIPAIRRSFVLTAGNRWRLAGFAAIVLMALVPALMLVNVVIFGTGATAESAAATIARMTLASPALWIDALVTLLILSFLAPAPAVAYMQLVGRR